jgi:hypothetical protein
MRKRSKKIWLHPDSGLEGLDGCLRLIFTLVVVLAVVGLLLCLLGVTAGAGYKTLTCVFQGNC